MHSVVSFILSLLLYLMPPLRQALSKSNTTIAVAPGSAQPTPNQHHMQALVQTEANDSPS